MSSRRERGAAAGREARKKESGGSRSPEPKRDPKPAPAAGDLIAVDVGNSETVVGLFSGGELATHWRLTSGRATTDEVSLTLDALLRRAGGAAAAPGFRPGAVLCSVAPSLTLAW